MAVLAHPVQRQLVRFVVPPAQVVPVEVFAVALDGVAQADAFAAAQLGVAEHDVGQLVGGLVVALVSAVDAEQALLFVIGQQLREVRAEAREVGGDGGDAQRDGFERCVAPATTSPGVKLQWNVWPEGFRQ